MTRFVEKRDIMEKMTFGQNSVGLKSTPKDDDAQGKFDQILADAIDQMHQIRITSDSKMVIQFASATIDRVLTTLESGNKTFHFMSMEHDLESKES